MLIDPATAQAIGRNAGLADGRLAMVGAGVLLGVLAFRYVLLYSALAAVN